MLKPTKSCISRDCADRLRVLQKLAHVGFWELDLVNDTLYWSDEIYRIFEIDPDSFQPSYAGFLNTIHPDDRAAVDAAYLRSLETRGAYEIRHRLLMPDGRVKYVDENCETIFDAVGTPLLSRGTVQDVTERQVVKLELEENRARTRAIIDSMNAFVGLCGVNGTLLETNRYPLEQAGLEAAEVLGLPLWESYWFGHTPEAAETVHAALQQAAHGSTVRMDLQLRMGIASRITGDFTFGPLLDSTGRIVSVVVYGVDVSQRRRAENALAEQEHKLRTILDSEPECVKIVSQAGALLEMNPAGLAMIQADDIEEARTTNLLKLITAPYRKAFIALHERVLHGATETLEFEIIGLKGKRRMVETRAVPIQLGEGRIAMLGVTSDITSRKRFERTLEALNTVLSGDPFFIHVAHTVVQVLEADMAFICELDLPHSGMASTRVLVVDGQLVPNIDYPITGTPCEPTIAGSYCFYPDRLQQRFPEDDALKQMGAEAYAAIPLLDNQNRPIGLIGIMSRQPITNAADIQSILQILSLRTGGELQRERQEASLRQLNDTLEQRVEERTTELMAAKTEAERANSAKTEFLSRMSHELRTPMNAILGYTQLLETDTSLAPQHREDIKLIANSGWHLLDLINDLLDFAKIEAGRLDLLIETVLVQDVVADCIATIAPLAARHQVSIHPPANPCPCLVSADRVRLRQVLINLLTNAVKYNREGGSVTIECRPTAEGYNQIVVSDTGIGIREEDMPLLFQPFSRLYLETYAIEGSGIGLALSKQLTAAMGGSIQVRSVKDVGSTFTIELPLAGSAALPAPEVRVAGKEPEGRLLVLYIEDSPAHLRLMRDILAKWPSVELIAAHNAELGVELAACHLPDIILLDISLPSLDGYATLRLLRDNPATSDIPVIALSANALQQDVQRGREAGFFDYLTKPIQIQQFLDCMTRAIAQIEKCS